MPQSQASTASAPETGSLPATLDDLGRRNTTPPDLLALSNMYFDRQHSLMGEHHHHHSSHPMMQPRDGVERLRLTPAQRPF